MTAAAYSGLAVVGIVGSPLIVPAVLIGGVPYIVYRVVKAKRDNGGGRFVVDNERWTTERTIRSPARVLQPDEMVGQDEEEFDSQSTRLTAFSELVVEARARGMRIGAVGLSEDEQLAEGGEAKHESGQAGDDSAEEEARNILEECRLGRPFVLERRRGSVISTRIAKRTVF